jgi:Family of unknown function (DUF6445)
MTPHAIRVLDHVMDAPEQYRAAALACDYGDIVVGDPSVAAVTFHGMAQPGRTPLATMLAEQFGLTTTLELFRLSPEGQEEPSFIHTDRDMGEWTAILYLHPDPPAGDGTRFWREKATGAIQSTAQTEAEHLAEWQAWRDRDRWEPWHLVSAQFNRLLLFPAPYFHSRAIYENYGQGHDSRLIQLAFGTGIVPCV